MLSRLVIIVTLIHLAISPALAQNINVKDTPEDKCHGCSRNQDGGWLVWRSGACKVTGICNSSANTTTVKKDTPAPGIGSAKTESACENAGGFWCEGLKDYQSKSISLCIPSLGTGATGKSCGQVAAEKGYILSAGIFTLKCLASISNLPADHPRKAEADALCQSTNGQADFSNFFGSGIFQCQVGVNGYSGGSCTSNNDLNKSLTSIPKCFCGTIQQDTGSGHNTYMSACGCGKSTGSSTSTSSSSSSWLSIPGDTRVDISSLKSQKLAVCRLVRVFDTSWTLLAPSDLLGYSPGQQIYLCVSGASNVGTFTQARFNVNGVERPITSLVKSFPAVLGIATTPTPTPISRALSNSTPQPKSTPYVSIPTKPTPTDQYLCDLYTLPESTYDFNVAAQIYNTILGWR